MTENTRKRIKEDIRKYKTLMEYSKEDNLIFGKIANYLMEIVKNGR